jgi:hypothetical protein
MIFSGVPISEAIRFNASTGMPSIQINHPMVPDDTNDITDNK